MATFDQAVQSLAKGITSKKKSLNKQEKLTIAKELLKHANPGNHSKWAKIEINLDPSDQENLQEYLGELQDAYNQEVGKDISQTINKVEKTTNLRNRLQQEINQALNETKDLEKIAKRLQDKGIGKIAGKEEEQVNKLGEGLERINREGKELEKDKQKITQILNKHNLDQSDLHEELGKRASTVETILQASGSKAGGGSANNLDQIAQRIIRRESKLREAENRGIQQLEHDIKTLSEMVELEEQEIRRLEKVEKHLYNRNLDFVETGMRLARDDDILDELVDKREEFGQNSKHIREVRKDLQKEKELIEALSSFFNSLENLNQKSIPRNKLYNKMASEGAFSTTQDAQSFVENIENEFNQIKKDIKDVERLDGKERKLENLEHEKIKEIDKKSSELWQNAQNAGDRKRLKKILKTLKKLDFNLNRQVGQVIELKNEKHIRDWFQNYNKASTDEIRDWKPVIAHPEDHLNVRDEIKSLSDNEITYYDISNESSFFSYPDNYRNYKTPEQGFKFHVTAYPHEAYEVCKELIPILQKLGVAHKVMTDIRKMAQKMNKGGSFREVQGMKLFTIYPGFYENDPKEQIFKPGDINNNEKYFFSNQSHTEYVMEKILELAEDSIIQGGPELKGKRNKYDGIDVKEYRVKNTRLHLTYSFIGGSRSMEVNGNEISVEKWVREKDNNGDWQSRGNFREAGTFDKNGNYSSSDYFLSHLLQEKDSRRVKKYLVEGDEDPDKAIIGLDGKIAGAYYLPPPEAVERIKQMRSGV